MNVEGDAMRGGNVFLTIAVVCLTIFVVSWFAAPTAEFASYEPSRGAAPSEAWLTLGNISGVCGIVSLMIQVWQWRRS